MTTILDEAKSLVYGDRGESYGHPSVDLGRTALMWSALFGWAVGPEQVAMAMICVKLSRERNGHKRDNIVDIAGYAACLEMIVEDNGPR